MVPDSTRRPIGMFDSGFGGLTVARAVIDLLPHEDLVYIGDTARYPYGSKPLDEVREHARELARSLVEDFGAKVIVVACNTAAAAVPLEEVAEELGVPVLGVVDPGARSLVSATRSGRVGVIGTVGTIGSGAYVRAVEATGANVELSCAACPGFVEFVERGQIDGDEVLVLAERLLAPVVEAGVDTLLLGCTHYPFLARVIAEVMGPDVVLVSSADETAFALASLLGSSTPPGSGRHVGQHSFWSSGDVDWFVATGQRLLGPELVSARRWFPGGTFH